MPIQTHTWDLQQPKYQAALQNFVASSDWRAQVLLNAAPGNRYKLPVSTLGLTDVVGDNGLQAASPSAWRYIAEANGRAVACEVTLSSPRITTLIEGPAADQAFQSLAALHGHSEVQGADFGVVHLRVAGGRAEAYWLRSGPGGTMGTADRLVLFSTPLNNALKPIPGATQFWKPTDFLGAIRPTAQNHLNFYGGDLSR